MKKKHNRKIPCLCLLLLLTYFPMFAQNVKTVTGLVLDSKDEPIIGATVKLKGHSSVVTVTDLEGKFVLKIPTDGKTLTFTYVGMEPTDVNIGKGSYLKVRMEDSNVNLNDVVVVGYGQQKKVSVVGAITQTNSKVLERTGGVSSLGEALTGNLPGVITMSSSGMPGAEDPEIVIRGVTSWNNSSPLILVDGVERSISTVDISSVESVSVLKDASATAVYGVKGANGVVLITTKRGTEGKPKVEIKVNMTAKVASKLPEKYDSYDALMLRNEVIERELGVSPTAWDDYTPMEIIKKYRYPANSTEWDQYPNVDWEKELFKNMTTSYNFTANISGGTKYVDYFSSIDFIHEGDLFKTIQNGRGYHSGYGFNRINVRSNLDFRLTPTTTFSTNLFGSCGVRRVPWGASDSDAGLWKSVYLTAPDAMRPIYSDGTYGFYSPWDANVPNSVYDLATAGEEKRTTTKITSDFILDQKLDMLLKGLSFKGDVSFDNTFYETGRGINDLYHSAQQKWVNPVTGVTVYKQSTDSGTQLDFDEEVKWSSEGGSVNTDYTYRNLFYSAQLNWVRQFGMHNITAMGLFSRERTATGSEFPHFREDWVFRTTYNYAEKYFAEINGAYNGSEKFGPSHRFHFFPSFSGGWMMSEEKFMKPLKFIDMLKFRASWGKVGDDNITTSRWLYEDQWTYSGNTYMGSVPATTPYTFYYLSSLGNSDISWERATKRNYGVDYSFFHGLVAGSVDVFNEHRNGILISGSSRSVPSYFGMTAPTANLGKVTAHGYEIELRLSKTFRNGIHAWANTNMTHAVNKVIFKDDPELEDAYQKSAGHSISQTYSYINNGTLNTWDDLYGSTERTTDNAYKLVGDYNIVDFNGDGTIDSNDEAPYGYTGTPQNTYSISLGAEWKGFSVYVQFYGVNNVTREIDFPDFYSNTDVVYKGEGSFWSLSNESGVPLPRWTTIQGSDASGTRYLYDGSYLRLKNAEIAYTFTNNWIKRFKIRSCKVFLNGNNLLLWTKMPDDRESNFSTSSYSSYGAYPTLRRFNLGIDINL